MIDLATQFSPYPSGRFPSDGTFNGETFRDVILVPALNDAKKSTHHEKVIVDIDGVRTFGSSFLEEAFGGLIRHNLFTKDDIKALLEVRCTKPYLLLFKHSIESYIKNARPENLAH